MKKEQLKDKFIICRTRDEYDFITYWAKQLFDYNVPISIGLPRTIRFKAHPELPSDICGQARTGFYSGNHIEWGCEKEEECSVLFGNLVKRWRHENRT